MLEHHGGENGWLAGAARDYNSSRTSYTTFVKWLFVPLKKLSYENLEDTKITKVNKLE